MPLKDKIALVTGAGSGIGRALAVELVQNGARVLLVGRRHGFLEDTRSMLPVPGRASVLAADLTEPTAIARLAESVAGFGRLDLLINNAGMVASGKLALTDAAQRRRMIETNLIAPMELTLALLPLLRATKASRIVNVGSMFGDIAFPYFAAYSASKFGLRGWSEALRRELAPDGVAVTYAAPRGTRTPAAEGFSDLVQAFEMTLDPPETVARQIVEGVQRGARDIYPQGPERLFVLLQRLLPRLIDNALIKQTAKAMGRLSAVALTLMLSALPPLAQAHAADLTVTVSGVHDGKEAVRIALYADADSFRHEAKARQVLSVPAAAGAVNAVFHDLPDGRYAVLAYHDENGNGKLDMTLGMFPDEGWGLSNDPTVIGPPRFEASAFPVTGAETTVTVPLHY